MSDTTTIVNKEIIAEQTVQRPPLLMSLGAISLQSTDVYSFDRNVLHCNSTLNIRCDKKLIINGRIEAKEINIEAPEVETHGEIRASDGFTFQTAPRLVATHGETGVSDVFKLRARTTP